eukprot:jgi/Mesvir1/21426/Mv20897-RA.1
MVALTEAEPREEKRSIRPPGKLRREGTCATKAYQKWEKNTHMLLLAKSYLEVQPWTYKHGEKSKAWGEIANILSSSTHFKGRVAPKTVEGQFKRCMRKFREELKGGNLKEQSSPFDKAMLDVVKVLNETANLHEFGLDDLSIDAEGGIHSARPLGKPRHCAVGAAERPLVHPKKQQAAAAVAPLSAQELLCEERIASTDTVKAIRVRKRERSLGALLPENTPEDTVLIEARDAKLLKAIMNIRSCTVQAMQLLQQPESPSIPLPTTKPPAR